MLYFFISEKNLVRANLLYRILFFIRVKLQWLLFQMIFFRTALLLLQMLLVLFCFVRWFVHRRAQAQQRWFRPFFLFSSSERKWTTFNQHVTKKPRLDKDVPGACFWARAQAKPSPGLNNGPRPTFSPSLAEHRALKCVYCRDLVQYLVRTSDKSAGMSPSPEFRSFPMILGSLRSHWGICFKDTLTRL